MVRRRLVLASLWVNLAAEERQGETVPGGHSFLYDAWISVISRMRRLK